MGFTLSTHYCMGRAVDTEFLVGAHDLNCGMMDMESNCDMNAGQTSVMPPGCCENQHLSLEIQDDYQHSNQKIDFVYDLLYTYITVVLYQSHDSEHQIAHNEIFPPPIEPDFQSLYQTYLL
jgi:hypothetical protein